VDKWVKLKNSTRGRTFERVWVKSKDNREMHN
jgi:hypothetical protein